MMTSSLLTFRHEWEMMTGSLPTFGHEWAMMSGSLPTFGHEWAMMTDSLLTFRHEWEMMTGSLPTFGQTNKTLLRVNILQQCLLLVKRVNQAPLFSEDVHNGDNLTRFFEGRVIRLV